MTLLSRGGLPFALLALSVLAAPGQARADDAGDAVVRKMDATLNPAKSLRIDYAVRTQERGKPDRVLAITVQVKGEKRLLEVTSPGDAKGTKLLVAAPSQAYVYLPAFGKVRRVAAHMSDQGFMGMTFNEGDLGTNVYGSGYTAVIASQDEKAWKLALTPKPGATSAYAKLEITVMKDRGLPAELKYFDAAGVNVKTETRTGYTCEGGACTAGELTMTDNVKGASTKLVVSRRELNPTLSDDLFSTRALAK